jgi:polygalacturonase
MPARDPPPPRTMSRFPLSLSLQPLLSIIALTVTGFGQDYAVSIDGSPLEVRSATTLRSGPASFASFDLTHPCSVRIDSTRDIVSAKVLPASKGIAPKIEGRSVLLTLDHPCNLTLELNGSIDRPLHLFANPPETLIPSATKTGVVYFGPGTHIVTRLPAASNQTIYLAEGAVLKAVIAPDEKPVVKSDWSGCRVYKPLLKAEGLKNISVRGRGVIDLSSLPWHSRATFEFWNCTNILVEGITIVDAPGWVLALRNCKNATVRGIKEICQRENSDGIDLCNSQDVLVEDCFLRNNDDEICVKTPDAGRAMPSCHIVVRRCVIWNERARGLGITSETRRDIFDVVFRDCDIMHDFSSSPDCSPLAVLVSDSGTVSGIRFEDIRCVQNGKPLIRCWIGADCWGKDRNRGHIKDITFAGIDSSGCSPPGIDLSGFDATHAVEDVTFENLRSNGNALTNAEEAGLKTNGFVRNVLLLPQSSL